MAVWRLDEDQGAGLIEWALAVVLIAVVAIAAVGFMGNQTTDMWDDAGAGLSGDLRQFAEASQPSHKPGPPGLCNRSGQAPGNGAGAGHQPPPAQRCAP